MKERLLELIASQFNLSVNDLEEDMSFQDDLNADSIELVELIMSIEDEFEIEIDDERLESLKTVGDVLEYVEELEQ
ncbi:acyl carrier protein [Peptoniphilus raoultii]|uniref:acyl carrier protein n=1 Tax=Peptoniphilus raoultii TaxID=1776387 RepID=UPI0008D987C0|nr:acyl carrier protein [Peptoniphilus raoultii]